MAPDKNLSQRFTWGRFLISSALQGAVIAALEYYWRWTSGKWEGPSLVVVPVFIWINIAMGYRWRQIRQEQKDGSFAEEKYLANPSAYIMGSARQRGATIAVAVIIGIVGAIVLPRAF